MVIISLLFDNGLLGLVFPAPGPCVSVPHLRDNVQRRWLGTSVVCNHSEGKFFFVVFFLAGLDEDVLVSALVEDAGIEKLIFAVLSSAARIFVNKVLVGEFLLGVFVQIFHVRVLFSQSMSYPRG